jgi:large subunit ribosomal protein L15
LQQAIDAKRIDASKEITEKDLMEKGIVSKARDGVRLLGGGEIKAKLNISVSGATASAVAAVEKAGGKVSVKEKEAKNKE